MADLVLGPLLRHVGANDATVWVETDAPCEVGVLGHSEPTFTVEGHHYALVCIGGLEPRTRIPYEVALDGERRWPPPNHPFPPSVINTIDPARPHVIEVRRGFTGTRMWGSAPGEGYHSTTGEPDGIWRLRGRPPQTAMSRGLLKAPSCLDPRKPDVHLIAPPGR